MNETIAPLRNILSILRQNPAPGANTHTAVNVTPPHLRNTPHQRWTEICFPAEFLIGFKSEEDAETKNIQEQRDSRNK